MQLIHDRPDLSSESAPDDDKRRKRQVRLNMVMSPVTG
jgi:hypothetical protein